MLARLQGTSLSLAFSCRPSRKFSVGVRDVFQAGCLAEGHGGLSHAAQGDQTRRLSFNLCKYDMIIVTIMRNHITADVAYTVSDAG